MDTPVPAPSGYPIVLTDLSGVGCTVIGGGSVAERKVEGLIAAGARPRVVSPTLTPKLRAWRDQGKLEHHPRRYRRGDLAGSLLTIAASSDADTNREVAAEADRLGALVNVVTASGEGSFHTPATVRRGELLLSVSTAGANPSLAAHIRRDLEDRYGPKYAHLVALGKTLRDDLKRLSREARCHFWRELTDSPDMADLDSDDLTTARAHARGLLLGLARAVGPV